MSFKSDVAYHALVVDDNLNVLTIYEALLGLKEEPTF